MGKRKKLQHDFIETRYFHSGKEPKMLNILTSKDLVKMTDNFSKENFIGNFQFGRLYRGSLEQQHVTIKIWDPPEVGNLELQDHHLRLMDELIFLRHQSLVHPCIVSLYGYCRDKELLAVVYNLKSMNSLHNLYLEGKFTLLQRIKVAFAIACLFKFLQDRLGDLDPFLIRNFSAAHVMLDEEYNPKLVDFSMLTGGIFPNKQIYDIQPSYGCHAYWDPDIRDSNPLLIWTKESDVFAFGIMLISLISKKIMANTLKDDKFLENWAYKEYKNGRSLIHETLQSDPSFCDTDGYMISMLCVHCTSDREDRPTIMEVVQRFLSLRVLKVHKDILGVDKMLYVNKKPHSSVSKPLSDIIKARDTKIDYLSCGSSMDISTFSFNKLRSYTKNFSKKNYLGRFQFGKLFRGHLPTIFAGYLCFIVKIWDKKYSLDDRLLKLADEMLLLHHEKYTCHPGMVRMFGYCIEDDNVAIVSFCKAKDSLLNLLHKDDFDWLYRIKAVSGVASLLKFLHAAPHRMDPFIIGNLDITNILLDEKYNPKLVDFGWISGGIFPSRPMDNINGTLTTESDVYFFGLLLMHLISKRRTKVSVWQWSELEDKRLVHPSLQADPTIFYHDDGHVITRLVDQCMQSDPASRPTMFQIVETFHKLKLTESHPEVMEIEKIFQEKCSVEFDDPYKNMPDEHHVVKPFCPV